MRFKGAEEKNAKGEAGNVKKRKQHSNKKRHRQNVWGKGKVFFETAFFLGFRSMMCGYGSMMFLMFEINRSL